MAESASSVASFDVWGLFAIAVVASPLRRTCRRGPNRNDKRGHAADPTPQCRRPARSPSDRPIIILSPWQTERNYGGNEFFTIVNRLLTIANTGSGRVPLSTGDRIAAMVGQGERPLDYTALTTLPCGRHKTPRAGRLFTWIWSRSGQSPRNK